MALNHDIKISNKPKSYDPAELPRPSENIIIGDSAAARGLRRMAALAAATDRPLLLTGPTGSGKTVAARAVHAASAHRNGSFVAVNCSTLTRENGAISLFGISAARTHNQDSKRSMFAQARGGTLFLDAVADLPLDLQAILEKLLEGADLPGMEKRRNPNDYVRIIASTNQCLASLIGEGLFRQDLFYNLSLLTIPVPPLRQRRDDIPALIDYFLMNTPLADHFTLDSAAVDLMEAHRWPGNIRELHNVVARACRFHPGGSIGVRRMGALLNVGQPSRQAPVIVEPKSYTAGIRALIPVSTKAI